MFSSLSLVISVLLLSAFTCTAAPLLQERQASVVRRGFPWGLFSGPSAGIDSNLLSQFELMGQYSTAAYCPNNYNSPGDQLECPGGDCPRVQDADSVTTVEYSREEVSTDVTGFVAVDHTNQLIVISFRGSASLDNWRTNLDFDVTQTDICSDCTAHSGFWHSWLDARDRVLPAVQQASASFPRYRIAVTGHSLGGAIATLAAATLRNSGYSVALYNFGSPRIGGSRIATYITNQPGGNYRVTHWNDPIPRLPLLTMGFVHISPEYYINKPTGQPVQAGDINVYQGSMNLRGNMAWLYVDVASHEWYFDSISACGISQKKRGGLKIRGVEGDMEIVATF
ncbi:lipase precursor [Pyrenophora seminiperda CCB06]|uniref:Lipase n=1 Tax=Pyrenophora seminiperda CCB06 TaxID=1302712 RepID=A0A3M7MD35_9PLEO|nr:lipase precursor [Pyrenophora seminiperda CCB06]